ncbi:arylalkylamine N-acetyltransferase-like 2 isoform X2 [Glandiceps talaboti]
MASGDSTNTIILREMTESDIDDATEVLMTTFIKGEPMTICLGLTPQEDSIQAKILCQQAAKDGISVVAIDTVKDKIIGVATSSIHQGSVTTPSDQDNQEMISKYEPINSLLDQLEGQFNDYPDLKNNPDAKFTKALKLGVLAEYAGKGLGTRLRQATTDLAKSKGFQFTVASASAPSSQRLYQKLKFDELAEIKYSDFEFKGTYPFASITACPSIKLFIKKL